MDPNRTIIRDSSILINQIPHKVHTVHSIIKNICLKALLFSLKKKYRHGFRVSFIIL